MKKPKSPQPKPKRRGHKSTLLRHHLEDVSWRVLEEYVEDIRLLIRGQSGVYALFRRKRLYYVGLASNLMGRLKSHLRDRHHGAWDRFSVYLTADSAHIKELESLLLRIVRPSGNRVSGGLMGSTNLRSAFAKRITQADADRRALLLGGAAAQRRRRARVRNAKLGEAIHGIVDRRTPIRAIYKGTTYRGALRRDGRIRVGSKIYDSPSPAAREIAGRPVNGWAFFKYKNEKGEWVSLSRLRH